MFARKFVALAVLVSCWSGVTPRPHKPECSVPVMTEAGWVCGKILRADHGHAYVSFRGVPYAKQPIGELRFKELQPLERWSGYYNATSEGPVCPQHDQIYGRMMQPKGMSEACIYANIHVLLEFFPPLDHLFQQRRPRQFNSVLPIVVFIHGGGFSFGSGDADVYGPEYLVKKKVMVITFNYRLNVFGFLSLNSSSIPGNNGLRDMVTLLRWVKRNARAFGGNPDDVTLAGQNAGAVSAHLLSLSPVTDGLFSRLWLMSGVGTAGFYSPSPVYARFMANLFLSSLGINSTTAPEDIYRQLISTPIEKIIESNKALLNITDMVAFAPVIESPLPGVTRIIDDDPEVLVAKGRGKGIPLVIGFTNKECEIFRRRFEEIDIISKINSRPLLAVSPQLTFKTSNNTISKISTLIHQQYFNGTVNMANYLNLCSDQYFQYPAMKIATMRIKTGGAALYFYQFAYNNKNNVFRKALEMNYVGASHMEDMTYIFRVNSMLSPLNPNVSEEDTTTEQMTTFFTTFIETSDPVPANDSIYTWRPVNEQPELLYQDIETPNTCSYRELSDKQEKAKIFFDSIYEMVSTA